MALSTEKQILETVNSRKKILIVSGRDADGDSVSSCLAWYLFLKKMAADKEVDICIENFSALGKFSFLPAIDKISSDINNFKNFVISVNIGDIKINEISYDIKDSELNFIINSTKGVFEDKDIRLKTGDFKYDLIFSIGVHDLESLGAIYDADPEFFYKVPLINIDYSPKNEQFGQINSIDLTATSNSEIIFDLIQSIDIKLIDDDIATCLLAGLVDKTKSFKTRNVTPKALNIASQLMNENARKEEIVSNLFRTKTITGLKLWGKVLARLKMDEDYKIVWSLITKQDFLNTNTGEADLKEIIEELIISIPDAKIITILYEKENDEILGFINITNSYDARELMKIFSPSGSRNLARYFISGKNLLESEKEVIEEIRKKVGEIRN
ncbi:MAG: DHH family phosphoesterase [bacterium]